MNLIEQAARRLEELRKSGIEVPVPGGQPAGARAATPVNGAHAIKPVLRELDPPPSAPAARTSRSVNIDLVRLANMGYLSPDAPRSRIADEFRVIKRPLLSNARKRDPDGSAGRRPLIMVTSSLPGEGKTFVSVNLAISLAMELDTTVMLVDADVSRPSVLSRLGLPSAPGLLDLLTDPACGVSDVLLRTNIEKLTLLPAGRAQGHATELLASDSMNRLLDELANRYSDRVIVFDAPPLLPTTESRVLASHMGQVVVVVEAEKSTERVLSQALSTISSCPLVLPLLNKVERSEVGSYYGYYAENDAGH